ncbi:hypothetical protein [Kineococcus terrestris]|uniref:hypothetical protein n=1 Tax=Kineococcus terrestris TaxID=2044856 RepID=UPI0034DABB01
MSDQHVPFGAPTPPEPPAPQEAAGDEAREPGDGRAVRAVLASAAAVAVLGGGTLGFLWLSSTPGGDIAGAVPGGVRVQPSVSAPADGGDAVAFAASGRDIFGRTVGPTPVTVGSGDQTGASGGSTGSTGGSVVGGLPSGSVGGAVGGGTTVPTAVPTAGPTTAPGTATPDPPPVTTPLTPSDTRSTAPAWQKAEVKFVEFTKTGLGKFVIGGNQIAYLGSGAVVPGTSTLFQPVGKVTDRPMTEDEIKACQQSVKDAATVEEAALIERRTEKCTTTQDYVLKAVFVTDRTARAGWIVENGSKLPDAALGRTTGTVRVLGQSVEEFLVQVDRHRSQWVAEGGAVEGSPLTFLKLGAESIDRSDVAVLQGDGVQYFTVMGGGESAGVAF